MIKLSRTGITTLKRQYRAVLLKCLLINAGILLAANGAMAAENYYVSSTSGGYTTTQITLGTAAATDATAYATAAQGQKADTALQADSALNGANLIAGTVLKTALSEAVQTSLGKADTALQADSALNGAKLDAGTVSKTALSDGVQTSLGKADTALQADSALNGANLTAGSVLKTALSEAVQGTLDQVATNTSNISQNAGDIADIITAITVADDGNYIDAGTDVAGNLGALDTQVKANADDITVLKANTSTLGSAIGGTFDADGSFTHTPFSIANNISATDANIVTAIGDLDTAIGKVAEGTYNAISATDSVAANLQALDGALTSGNIDAKFASVEAAGGFKVDDDNFLTSDGLTAAAATIAGATSVGGTLTIGEANAITGTEDTLDMGGNSLTNIVDIASEALTTDSTEKTVNVGGEDYTISITGDTTVAGTLGVTDDFAVNTDKFTVDAETGNTTVAGTLTIGEANAITGTEDTLDMGGNSLTNIVDITAAGALTADGESKFAKDGEDVYSLDVTTDGVTANKVVTAVEGVIFGAEDTVAMTSAAHSGAVAADASEQGQVVASIQSVADTRQAINADAIEVLGGIYSVSTEEGAAVSYNNDALAGTNGFDNAAGDLTEALTNYANHVAAATGLSYDATGANVTTYARADEVNYAGIADNTSLRDAIVQLDTNIGDAPETAGLNNVLATNTVNANIDAVNTALGDVQTAIDNSHYGNGAADMSEMVSKVDNKLYALDRDVRKLKKEFKAGMASVAAMSALVPNARANGNTQLSVGTGAYDGHMAAAIGGFHWFNNNVMMNVGVAYGDSSEATYRAGLTFTW